MPTKYFFDPLTNEPTIIATNRAKRANQFGVEHQATQAVASIAISPPKKLNYFAKGNESLTPPTLYQDADDWNVRVFQNKYPLMEDHEIVVHSPAEDKDIEDFSLDQTVRIIRAYLNRAQYYINLDKDVFIFNNRGGRAGASLEHPHSQIIASEYFPGTSATERNAAFRYYTEHGRSYWLDELAKELAYKKRIIYESSHFVLFVPEISRWSYEMRLTPKRHMPSILQIDEAEIYDFAFMLRGALVAYNALFNRPDRNFWIHTMRYKAFHWHLGFLPHIKVFGALELGAGIWVCDKATSEDAAAELKNAFPTT